MKIIISYPPLNSAKGHPTLGQNRQFQYFKEPTFIYPVVPAQAATLLKEAGHEVIWNDCIAEGLSEQQFMDLIIKEKPDLIAMETKTPVVKQHWEIIDKVKGQNLKVKVVLFGDHVTALPEESFEKSKVDFVITGGDYDFLLLNLCNYLVDPRKARLEPGMYFPEDGEIVNSGKFKLNHDLNTLPFIDRELTKWKNYAYENGNYKSTPGTYIMAGRDCWYHACSFCSWPTLYPEFRTRSVGNVLKEIDMLTEKFKVREIMDDSGCFPVKGWLEDFVTQLAKRDNTKRKIYFDCNMRFGACTKEDFLLMKKANFRLLLFGLESANQTTLDRINKGVKVEQIVEDCRTASSCGLFPHITIMFGYPWETYEEAMKTLELGIWLLKKGLAYTMQATMVIPYPGTPLFEECRQLDLLRTLDWDAYDMRQPVMKTPITDEKIAELVRGMYKISFQPEFIIRKISSIRDADDLKYFVRTSKKIFGHLFDFSSN